MAKVGLVAVGREMVGKTHRHGGVSGATPKIPRAKANRGKREGEVQPAPKAREPRPVPPECLFFLFFTPEFPTS